MIKLDDEQQQKLKVVADTHFGHQQEFIYKQRGFDDVEQMNDHMINTINESVGEDGILLHLGDFCLNTPRDQYLNILKRLKIKELWMIWGNHNNPIQRSYGGRIQQVSAYHGDLKVRYWEHYLTMRHKRNHYVCFHYPIAVWDGMGQGAMHLCGHSHGNHQLSRPEDLTHKILDCGWDVHHKPLSLVEINTIMQAKGPSPK